MIIVGASILVHYAKAKPTYTEDGQGSSDMTAPKHRAVGFPRYEA